MTSSRDPEVAPLVVREVELALGRTAVTLPRARATLDAEVSAHLFDYGAISICFDMPITPGPARSTSNRFRRPVEIIDLGMEIGGSSRRLLVQHGRSG
jgi:hypothetical protein